MAKGATEAGVPRVVDDALDRQHIEMTALRGRYQSRGDERATPNGPGEADYNTDDEDDETRFEQYEDDDEGGSRFDGKATGYHLYTGDENLAVLKKLDRRVVFFIAGLYLLSFLDRSNIGNARIAGLEADLQLTSNQYEWLLTIFYIFYIMFEWMTLLFRIFPPHIYISIVVMAWGVIASTQALTTSFTQMLFLRILLGISEAAFCGVPFYLSFFFKRSELASRIGYFISAAPLATAFASSLAWLITGCGQWFGIDKFVAPWRLLFLVEGFPSCLVAVMVWRHLPDGPDSCRFLTRRERQVALLRVSEDNSSSPQKHNPDDAEKQPTRGTPNPSHEKIHLAEVLRTLRDPKSYLTAFMFFSLNVAFSSTPVFLPTILKDMSFSPLMSQLLTAPPYLVSFVSILITSRLSDRSSSRSPYLIFHSALATSGYVYMLLAGLLGFPPALRYLGVYPACIGFFSSVTLIITWTLNNQRTASGRGTGVSVLQMIGQCGPLLGTRIFPRGDAPLYTRGMAVCAFFMAMVGVLAYVLRVVLTRENGRIRAKGELARGAERSGLVGEGEAGMGEETFVYML